MIFGKPPDHLIKVATLIKDYWRLCVHCVLAAVPARGRRDAFFFLHYFCMAIWVQAIVTERYYPVHVSMLECSSPFWCACEGTLTSHPTPPQMRMLMNMSASHCDWTSLFCARVSAHSVVRMWKNVNIPPHSTPHHPRPHAHVDEYECNFPGGWLIVSCVSAQVSEFYVTQCASEEISVSKWVCFLKPGRPRQNLRPIAKSMDDAMELTCSIPRHVDAWLENPQKPRLIYIYIYICIYIAGKIIKLNGLFL